MLDAGYYVVEPRVIPAYAPGGLVRGPGVVVPAKAGIPFSFFTNQLGSRLRGNDSSKKPLAKKKRGSWPRFGTTLNPG